MKKDCTDCLLSTGAMESTEEIQLLTQYVPFKIAKFIGSAQCCIYDHTIENLSGTICFFDIIGFTPIVVDYITKQRDIGELSETLSEFYSVIIESVREFGGSVFQFAGDSLLICFEQTENESMADNFKRSFASMLRAFELSDNYNHVTSESNGFTLKPKIGIGCGAFHQIFLGSKDLFITPVLTGHAVHASVECEKSCTKQEIVISADAFAYAEMCSLAEYFTNKDELYHLISIPDSFFETVTAPDYVPLDDLFENPRFQKRLASFLNPIIVQQIKNSYQGFSGEYKDVTCCMIRFDGSFVQALENAAAPDSCEILNTIYTTVQSKTQRYGGYCMKPDISDKGVVFPVVFGTPAALENKEQNALLCAVEILSSFERNTDIQSVSIGMATGMVYTGEFGGFLRKDYTTIGNTINFASRLMMYAASQMPRSILFDSETEKSIGVLCTAKTVNGITCKGYEKAQTAYLFTGIAQQRKNEEKEGIIIGRTKELTYLQNRFSAALNTQHISITSLCGDAGIGKTYLLNKFVYSIQANNPGILILRGTCYQYEEKTAFFCWRPVIRQICTIADGATAESAQDVMNDIFASYFPNDLAFLPVVLNILGFDLPESAEIADMDVPTKQQRLFDILLKMLCIQSQNAPIIIILENMQWSDTVSLDMIAHIIKAQNTARIFIVVAMRDAPGIVDFFESNYTPVFRLEQISESAATQLTNQLLNMKNEVPALTQKIVATADGNPFFIENIVHSLLESGTLVETTDGHRLVSENITNIQNIAIPSSIQNIILSRLNALNFEDQIICKTAAVIGRTFSSDCLKEMRPDGISEQILQKALETFENHNIIINDENPDSEYTFKHLITHNVIYDTILDATKRELNNRVLSYLEKKYAKNYAPVIERLEYHAAEAKQFDKVFIYALSAAEKAEKKFAVQDAITHYTSALAAWNKIKGKKDNEIRYQVELKLADGYRTTGNYPKSMKQFISVIQTAQKQYLHVAALRGLGRCYQEQGRFEDAVSTLEKALRVLGKKAPRSRIAVYAHIVKEALYQFYVIGLRLFNVKQFSIHKSGRAKIQTDILCELNKLYYFGALEKIAWSSISNFNTALRISNDNERLCLAAGDYAVSTCSAGLPGIGKKVYDIGNACADKISSGIVPYIFKARYAYYYLFYNDPQKSIALLKEATEYFERVGEKWELMTAEGALAQNYFLIGDFTKSIAAYIQTEHVATILHSAMHIGWSYNKVPFMRYLQKEITAEEAEKTIQEGVQLSSRVHDHMTLCIHYGHLASIATQEQWYDKALQYAELIMHENKIYTVNIPHIKISYVNVVEAICAAVLHNAVSPQQKSHFIARAEKACKTVLKLSKKFLMLAGPATRAAAAYELIKGNTEKAIILIQESERILRDSPYEWEYQETQKYAKLIQSYDSSANKEQTIT